MYVCMCACMYVCLCFFKLSFWCGRRDKDTSAYTYLFPIRFHLRLGVPDLYTYYFGKRTWHKDIRVAKEVGSDLKPGIQLSRVLDLFFRVLREGIRPCFKTKS